MEYVKGVQLTKKFKSNEKFVSQVIKQILEAVQQMQQKKVVHRDLKPENILYNEETGQVKISDFGWSSIDGEGLDIMCGTLDYLSPEMANQEVYDEKVDLWSIGVLTYELIFGTSPFKGENKAKTIEKVKNLDYSFEKEG